MKKPTPKTSPSHKPRSPQSVTGKGQPTGSVSYKDGMITMRGLLAERFQRIVALTGKAPWTLMKNAIMTHSAPMMKKDTIRVTLEFRPGTTPHRQLLAMIKESGELPDSIVAALIDNDLRQQTRDTSLLPCEADLVSDYAEKVPPPSRGVLPTPPHKDRVQPVGIELVAGKKMGVRK